MKGNMLLWIGVVVFPSCTLQISTRGSLLNNGKILSKYNPEMSFFEASLESFIEKFELVKESNSTKDDFSLNDPKIEQYQLLAVVAVSVASTLLFCYVIFVLSCLLYDAMKSSGRTYVRVDAEDRILVPENLPAIQEQVLLPKMPKGSFAQVLIKGKEKIKPSGGKPVIYPTNS